MLKQLVEQARALPAAVERLAGEMRAARQELHDALEAERRVEAEVAGQVAAETAGDGRKRYPNEESRRAETLARLAADAAYQELERRVRAARERLANIEARLERMRGEHRTATALIHLLAAAVQAGRQDVEEAVLAAPAAAGEDARREAARRFSRGCRALRQAGGGDRGREAARGPERSEDEGLLEAEVAVLEVSVNGRGTTRAWCQDTATGDKVAVFGKGEAGERLRRALRGKVRVAYRALDAGWFAVKVG